MSGQEKTCIGHGEFRGACGNVIGPDDLALNSSGLWCVRCERARRKYISAQFEEIKRGFSSTSGDRDE